MHGWTLLPSQFYLECVFAENFLWKVQMCFQGIDFPSLYVNICHHFHLTKVKTFFRKLCKMLILTKEVQSHFHSWISISSIGWKWTSVEKGTLVQNPFSSIDVLQKAPFSNSYKLQTNQIYNKLSS